MQLIKQHSDGLTKYSISCLSDQKHIDDFASSFGAIESISSGIYEEKVTSKVKQLALIESLLQGEISFEVIQKVNAIKE